MEREDTDATRENSYEVENLQDFGELFLSAEFVFFSFLPISGRIYRTPCTPPLIPTLIMLAIDIAEYKTKRDCKYR